jgi:hypothetical protein
MKIFKGIKTLPNQLDDLRHVDRGFQILLCQISKGQVFHDHLRRLVVANANKFDNMLL